MTAVEWLEKQYTQSKNTFQPHVLNRMMIVIFEKAKQMEKEQKIDMYNAGYEDATCNHINDAEQYYHQKYSHDSSRKS